jgi:phenylacetate-coenzyme A ligase PaaK-like adenylate-forming protein
MYPTTESPTAFDAMRADIHAEVNRGYPEQLRRMRWTKPEITAQQRTDLRALLGHAVRHSPFHARRLAGIDLERVEPTDLTALPIMTKRDMMAELDDVFTDRRLTRGMVEDSLARTTTEPVPILGGHIAFTSGGSSGERGVFVFDRAANVRFVGSVTRALVARLQEMGGPPPGGLPIAMVAASSAVHLTGAAPAMTRGGALPMRFVPIPVTLPLAEVVERLNAMQPPALYGYPTMLAMLAGEQLAGRLHIRPMTVTCSSEQLTPDLRSAIAGGFGAPVIDNFASTEGLIGISRPDDDVITFAEDGCVVELVDDRYAPVPPGTPSSKVLVTNLFNRLQPLIRYELTDSFVQRPAAADQGHLRATVHGRSDDVFRYGSIRVHPLVIRSVLVQSPEIAEYQVLQTAGGIEVLAVASSAPDIAGLRGRLAAALADAGLHRPTVQVRPSDRLERNPATGKLRRFVPLGSLPAPTN